MNASQWLAIGVCQFTNLGKPRFGAFGVVLERRNELAEVHFCLNVSNDIHRYLSALVSDVIFLSQYVGSVTLLRVASMSIMVLRRLLYLLSRLVSDSKKSLSHHLLLCMHVVDSV